MSGDGREAAQFTLLAHGLTGIPHWLLAASRRGYTLDRGVPGALYGIGLLGPSTAAFVLEGGRRGSEQRKLALAAAPRTLRAGRLAGALFAQPLLMLVAARLGRGRVTFRRLDPVRTAGQLWVVAGEEFGWRGYLLPRLRRSTSPAAAVGLMTAAWGSWHLPMFFVPGSPQAEDRPGQFAAAMFAWSAIHHLLQVGSPSVATAMVFHAAANTTERLLDIGNGSRWLTRVYLAAGAMGTLAAQRWDRARA